MSSAIDLKLHAFLCPPETSVGTENVQRRMAPEELKKSLFKNGLHEGIQMGAKRDEMHERLRAIGLQVRPNYKLGQNAAANNAAA